ncbi:single-stranded nucleic acid binding protein [Rhizophagus clarus]|uniref:Single-stranded nucleic acid binding protein n=1 Tax=Rhizophagus clarus TaxID=94130 RepID=A0A8H3LG47_9GLOM|nr:single-stranded nucleic acid binding protein [Rhizophagus clarus]
MSTKQTSTSNKLDDKRLYIGNLDSSINEYTVQKRALRAMTAMHSKLIKNRSMIVTFAYAAPENYDNKQLGGLKKRPSSVTNRPTTISLLKAHKMINASTDSKIQALERKLAQMKQEDASSNISTTKSYSQPSSPQPSTSLLTEKIKIERNLSAPTSPSKTTTKGGGKRFNPYVIPKSEK